MATVAFGSDEGPNPQWQTLDSGSPSIRTEAALGETNRYVPGIGDK
jgi:hypothetical protein